MCERKCFADSANCGARALTVCRHGNPIIGGSDRAAGAGDRNLLRASEPSSETAHQPVLFVIYCQSCVTLQLFRSV